MVTLIAVDSHVTEIPEAHKILHRNRDHDDLTALIHMHTATDRRKRSNSLYRGIKTMEDPEINTVDWTRVFLILALVLIALPFVLSIVLAIR